MGQQRAVAAEPARDVFEPQGVRRRAQIVAIAAHLIVEGGVESVTHAAVAERAGIVRTALYRYFPTRDDLIVAVHEAYAAQYLRRLSLEDTLEGMRELRDATPQKIPAVTRRVLEQQWAAEDWTPAALELRIAWLVIARDNELYSRLAIAHPDMAAGEENTLSKVFDEFGIGPVEREMCRGTMMNAQYHAAVAGLAGRIDREEAIRLTYRMTLASLNAFRN